MYAGRIVERGPVKTIFERPQHPYTWGLLRSIPRMNTPREDDLTPISGQPPSLINPPSGCSFHPRCPYVRPRHREVEPRLEAMPGDPGHQAACLLDPETRRRLWRELERGHDPEQARATVGLGSSSK